MTAAARSRGGDAGRQYSSRALTDTTCILFWMPVAELRERLLPFGLDLVPLPGAPRGMHPIWIDLGRIKAGAGEALQLDQHTWWRRTGVAAGSLLGLGAVWGSVAEEMSHGLSRTLGTYFEFIVSAPNVGVRGLLGGLYSFVLGMHTDSPVAIWGDRSLRYGYGKQLCQISAQPFESYTSRSSEGKELLGAKIAIAKPSAWRNASALPGLERQLDLMSQPLLGVLGHDQFAVSYLERDTVVADQATVAPARVQLRMGAGVGAGLSGTLVELPPLGKREPWGAFCARDVATRVSFPEHVSLSQL